MTYTKPPMYLPAHVLSLDFETSGLSPQWDQPTSITVMEWLDGEPTGQVFHRAIKPNGKMKISMDALRVQGLEIDSELTGDDSAELADKMSRLVARVFPAGAKSPSVVLRELTGWTAVNGLDTLPVVAHMASFDHGFYDNKINLHTAHNLGAALSPVWICTKTLACKVFNDKRIKVNLDSCLSVLGLEPRKAEGGHDSYEDAYKCGQVYFSLRQLWMQKHGETC